MSAGAKAALEFCLTISYLRNTLTLFVLFVPGLIAAVQKALFSGETVPKTRSALAKLLEDRIFSPICREFFGVGYAEAARDLLPSTKKHVQAKLKKVSKTGRRRGALAQKELDRHAQSFAAVLNQYGNFTLSVELLKSIALELSYRPLQRAPFSPERNTVAPRLPIVSPVSRKIINGVDTAIIKIHGFLFSVDQVRMIRQ
jgi:hypothetical protein